MSGATPPTSRHPGLRAEVPLIATGEEAGRQVELGVMKKRGFHTRPIIASPGVGRTGEEVGLPLRQTVTPAQAGVFRHKGIAGGPSLDFARDERGEA